MLFRYIYQIYENDHGITFALNGRISIDIMKQPERIADCYERWIDSEKVPIQRWRMLR